MRAGTMRKRVQLQSPPTGPDTKDKYGAPNPEAEYATFATVWASIEDAAGDERLRNHQITQLTTHVIRIRYRADVNHRTRILFGARKFEVLSVINFQERRIYLDIAAREVQL